MKPSLVWWAAIVISGMMTLGARIVQENTNLLPIVISEEYQVRNVTREGIASQIPEQKPATQLSMVLTRHEKEAHLFFWEGFPLRDLGPMQEQESWETTFLEGNAHVIRTTMFMGQQEEVLVLHYQVAEKARLMIYSKDMSKEEFHEMLNSMQRKSN